MLPAARPLQDRSGCSTAFFGSSVYARSGRAIGSPMNIFDIRGGPLLPPRVARLS